jgi:hypothetical protein
VKFFSLMMKGSDAWREGEPVHDFEKIGPGRLRSWSAVLPFRQAQGPEPAEGLRRFRNVCG